MTSSRLSPAVLVDTNVLSDLTRQPTNAGVIRWAGGYTRVSASAVTIEEMVYGLRLNERQRVEGRFEGIVREFIEVLPVTEAIARRSGELRAMRGRAGQTRDQADMLIAATALVHGLTLVTRNVRHFDGLGLSVLNPFS